MISVNYSINVPDFPKEEVPFAMLIRAHVAKFKFDVTNDGKKTIAKINVRAVLESYVGQDKAQLFQWADTKVIQNAIPTNGMESIEFSFFPFYPGLVSVALYVTDFDNNVVEMKRKSDLNYGTGPVRWWFHVEDDISFETLMLLRRLVAEDKEKKK